MFVSPWFERMNEKNFAEIYYVECVLRCKPDSAPIACLLSKMKELEAAVLFA